MKNDLQRKRSSAVASGVRQGIDVVVWGRLPPPIGGVTRSVEGMVEQLRDSGLVVEVVDPYHLQLVPLLRVLASSQGVSMYHISGPSGLIRFLPAIAVDRRPKALFLHAAEGGTTKVVNFPWSFRRIAPRFSKVWVTNAMLAEHVSWEIGSEVSVASPFSGLSRTSYEECSNLPVKLKCVTFMYNGHKLYNSLLAAESVGYLREKGVDASLKVVSYGSTPRAGTWGALEQRASEASWLSVVANTEGGGAETFLGEADLLLRLTTTDGDSMVLREALSLGLRVVASSEVPRPRGVELVDLTVESVSGAIVNGGRVSDGDGLGQSISDEFLNWYSRS